MNSGHYGFPNILGLVRATAFKALGKPGATAGATLAGGTVSGAPTSGPFEAGDLVVGQNGTLFVCTIAGSPGTWVQLGSLLNPMTAEGSLIQGAASGAPAELLLGSANQAPAPVGADVGWITPSDAGGGGVLDPTTTDGDLLYRKATTVSSLTIGFIGDSITAGSVVTTAPPTTAASALCTAQVTVSASNQGHSGATSADWVPGAGSGYLSSAKVAFAASAPPVRLVHVMLGTNDAKTSVATSATQYRANLLLLAGDLIAAGYIVAISYPPYLNTTIGSFDAGSRARVLGYTQQIDLLTDGGHILAGDTSAYLYVTNNLAALQGDGVHPTQAGSDTIAGLWANALRRATNALSGQRTLQRLALGSGLSISAGTLSATGGTLAGLTDVGLGALVDGHVLRYSTTDSAWHNVSPVTIAHWDILTDGASNIIYAAGDTVGVGTIN